MKIEQWPIERLIHYANNPRKNDHAVEQVAAAIHAFGFRVPIIAKSDGTIVDGHLRAKAAAKLKLKTVPVVLADDMTDTQIKAFRLSVNRMAELAEWDNELLKLEFEEIKLDGFDLELTGFDSEFLEELESKTEGLTDPDDVPELKPDPKSKLGDVWLLGNHRVMCGDSTDAASVAILMNGQKADLVHTDPPYNVAYSNQDRPKAGKKDLGTIANDEMADEEFKRFLDGAFFNSFDFSKDDSSIYIWYASKETINFHAAAAAAAGWSINQQIIWKKPMLLGRGKYQWAHEPCVFGVKGSPYFTSDRTKTTVWDFGGYDKSKNVHPTQKPIILCEEAINNSSKSGHLILDLFLGSGSTLIACEKTGRHCYGMEISPQYVDVILKRWQDFTGKKAVREDGLEFDSL